MPLSEDEQRILRQMEEDLQRDPRFGRGFQTRPRGSRRGLLLAGSSTVFGLALTIALLGVNPLLSFVTFVGAVVCAVIAERHVRVLGEAGLEHLSDQMRHRFPRDRSEG